jgi:NAD(P)H-hydrate epimerase
MTIPYCAERVPYISTSQIVEVDRLMIEEYRVELMQMMENAGRNLAHLARLRFLDGDPRGKTVAVAAGSGGNGGGALVCARRLSNWGADVRVVVTQTDDWFRPVPGHQLEIVRRLGLTIVQAENLKELAGLDLDLVVDGIIGYSLSGAPAGVAADLIRWANESGAPILALDVPSGLDTTSGTVHDPAVRATATMTLALPKLGLEAPDVEAYVGELHLADISVPPALYSEPSLGIVAGELFAESEIVRLS